MERVGKEGDWAVWHLLGGARTYISRIMAVDKDCYAVDKNADCVIVYWVHEFNVKYSVYVNEIKQFLTTEEAVIYWLEN